MASVLITGATGFIGGSLVGANLKKGHSVRALVLPGDPGAAALERQGVDVVFGDISRMESVRAAMKGAQIVFHCAAVVTDWAPVSLFRAVTVEGARNVCEAAAENRVSRLVHVSTNDVFGRDESRVLDESTSLTPWGEPYPDHKIEAERIMWEYHKTRGLAVTMVYPCWVYGIGDRTFVPLLADAIKKRDMIFWRKDVIVWPTYIENLTDLLMLMADDPRAVGQGFLAHDGESTTLQKFCEAIAVAIGAAPPKTHIPYSAAYAAAVGMEFFWRLFAVKTRPLLTTYTVKNLGSRLLFSIAKAQKTLGWTPGTNFAAGFAKTMEWIKTNPDALTPGK